MTNVSFPLDATRFPHLAVPQVVGELTVSLVPWVGDDGGIPDPQITHAYVVPFRTDRTCLVVMLHDLRLMIPGGTRDAGEAWPDTARREVLEETGHAVTRMAPFAAFEVRARSGEVTYRPVCWGDAHMEIEDVDDPDGPAGAAGVLYAAWPAVPGLFAHTARPDIGELYPLAAQVRASASASSVGGGL